MFKKFKKNSKIKKKIRQRRKPSDGNSSPGNAHYTDYYPNSPILQHPFWPLIRKVNNDSVV